MQPQESSQKTIIIATLAFVLGFALAWLIIGNKVGGTKLVGDHSQTSSTTSQEEISMGTDYVSLKDQVEGSTVMLDKVGLAQSGWVVIHEDDNGKPGKILGAQLFDAGAWTNGQVDLLRGTVSAKSYYAMLHSDNGDRAFDPKKDTDVMDANGMMVMTKFTATAAPAGE